MPIVIRQSTQTELYHRYAKMASSIARNFSQKYGKPLPEMADEAKRALGLAIAEWKLKYNRHRSCPSTYVYQAIFWHLTSICQPRARTRSTSYTDPSLLDSYHSKKESWYSRIWNDVGEEGRAFLRILFEAPGELQRTLSHAAPKRSHKRLVKYLRDHDWSSSEIQNAMKQVRLCL